MCCRHFRTASRQWARAISCLASCHRCCERGTPNCALLAERRRAGLDTVLSLFQCFVRQPASGIKCLLSCVHCAGLASYPIDTVRRRMMMTSGAAVKYDSSFACMQEIVKKEGVKSLFKVCERPTLGFTRVTSPSVQTLIVSECASY